MDVLLAFSPCAYTLHTLYSDLFSFMSIRLVSNAIRYVPFRESIQFINYFKKCVIHSNGTKAEINRGEVTADVPLIARVKFSNWTGFFRIIFFLNLFFSLLLLLSWIPCCRPALRQCARRRELFSSIAKLLSNIQEACNQLLNVLCVLYSVHRYTVRQWYTLWHSICTQKVISAAEWMCHSKPLTSSN